MNDDDIAALEAQAQAAEVDVEAAKAAYDTMRALAVEANAAASAASVASLAAFDRFMDAIEVHRTTTNLLFDAKEKQRKQKLTDRLAASVIRCDTDDWS